MRTLLTIIFVSQSARCLLGQTPLTVQEISLMLRSGYPSETILVDLSTRHFAGTLDSEAEKKLTQDNASLALLDALKDRNNSTALMGLTPTELEAGQRAAAAELALTPAQRAEKARNHILEEVRLNKLDPSRAERMEREQQARTAAADKAYKAYDAAKAASDATIDAALAKIRAEGEELSRQEQALRNETQMFEQRRKDRLSKAADVPPRNNGIVAANAEAALLPSEKDAMRTYPNLTHEELRSLLPSERAATNARRGAAIAAERAAAEEAWCAAHPVECAEEEAARERAKAQARAEAAARAEAKDRQQARQLVDQMQTSLMMGHSRDQLKTDLFMANGQAGPKTRQVIDNMQTNLFMGHSKEQLKTDLFMLNP